MGEINIVGAGGRTVRGYQFKSGFGMVGLPSPGEIENDELCDKINREVANLLTEEMRYFQGDEFAYLLTEASKVSFSSLEQSRWAWGRISAIRAAVETRKGAE